MEYFLGFINFGYVYFVYINIYVNVGLHALIIYIHQNKWTIFFRVYKLLCILYFGNKTLQIYMINLHFIMKYVNLFICKPLILFMATIF
jgi:hypothetical protein